jgi:glycine/D-amino acid oxidase-like deaminating enzyme
MRDYRDVSYWLETCDDDLTPRPALDGSRDADVAILGGGYTGLWTAYYLLKAQPGLRVVIVESEICGFGASGRNGAWCAPGLNISLPRLERRYGRDQARAVYEATFDAVDEVGRVTAAEGIDAGFHKGGLLSVARGMSQQPLLEADYEELVRFGFEDRYRLLDETETAARVRVDGARGALATPGCAVIHPARLVRGLARLVEGMGATIHERTTVTEIVPGGDPGPRPVLRTSHGDVTAGAVVLAGEAYLTRLPPLRRSLLPVYSLIVLTEPLSDARWDQIGWQGRECLNSYRLSIDYLSRTEDGRILFGGRGAPYRFGSPIRDEYDRHEPTHAMLRDLARAWFPVLRDVRFTHAWGGAVGMPRDWMPTFAYDRRTGIGTARGYTGHGVSTANLAGRVLSDLITERDSEITHLPMVNHRSRFWEPEPLRWLGVRFTQVGLARVDARAERTGKPPTGRSLPEIIARH